MAETFNDRLEKLTKQRLDTAIDGEKDVMAAGGLKDHGDYRFRAGMINGLRAAKEILEQALSDCQKN